MLVPIGKLVDDYKLKNHDIRKILKAIPGQIPEDVRTFISPGRFVQLGKDWHELAEYEREYSLGTRDSFGSKSIWPISVEYMKKYLNIVFRLANDYCGRPPLKGWDEVMQNLADQMNIDPDVAIDYLAREIRKAVIRCCLVEKTEAESFLIHNNYTLYTETNTEATEPNSQAQPSGLAPEASTGETYLEATEPAKEVEAAGQKNNGDPFAGLPPIKCKSRISSDGYGERQMENTRNENFVVGLWFKAGLDAGWEIERTAKHLMTLKVRRSIIACFAYTDSLSAGAADKKLERLLKNSK